MSIAIMMGGASHKEFWDRVHRVPPPMSENERRAMAAQIYPALLPTTTSTKRGQAHGR